MNEQQRKLMELALEAYIKAGSGNSTDFVLQGEAYDLAVEALAQPEQREPTKQEHNILMGALKRSAKVVAQPEQEPVAWNEFVELACIKIKAADDAAADRDYMLDSDDCISVLRGAWKAPSFNDQPTKPTTPPQRKPLTVHEISEFVGTHEYGPEQLKWFRLGEAAHGIKE